MSEKVRFWILIALLLASIALLVISNRINGQVLVG